MIRSAAWADKETCPASISPLADTGRPGAPSNISEEPTFVQISPAPDSRLRRVVELAAVAFFVAYAAGLVWRPGERFLLFQSNVVFLVPPLAALALSSVAVRRSRGRERLGWACMALLLVTWQVGDWVYSYYALARDRDPPFPGLADVFYFAGYIAFIAAIPLLTFPEWKLRDRRWMLDAATLAVVAGAIGWHYLMQPIVATSDQGWAAAGVALGYPVLDLALFGALILALYAANGRFSRRAVLLATAAAMQVITDGVYSYNLTTAGYDNVGNPLELGWIAVYLLIAASFVAPDEPVSAEDDEQLSPFGLVLPYVAIAPLAALVSTGAITGRASLVLIAAAVGVTMLVVARQFVTLRLNLTKLAYAANHDRLTRLPNRRWFEEEAERYLTRARRQGGTGAVLFIDLDDFKAVNETFGHRLGDGVIVALAEAIRGRLREPDLLARLEGDEFVALLPDTGQAEALNVATRLTQAIGGRTVVVEGRPVRTTASIGIALVPGDGSTADDLLTHAGQALDDAKRQGVGGIALFDSRQEAQAPSETRLVWKRRIHEALEESRFVLYAQPVVELDSGRLEEHELLIRMQDTEGRLVPPDTFLPVAERFGLIQLVDRWVVRRAIQLIAEQQRQGRRVRLAANVSGRSVGDEELMHAIRRDLRESGIEPAALVIEITETATITDMGQALAFVDNLKSLGCRFALDDFGAGFSSFHQIKDLPVDYLKIDGSFIRNLPDAPVNQSLVRAIAELARGLGKQTIAEYVQDQATVDLLRELGVDFGQGNHLGRPIPVEEALAAPAGHAARAA
ncbi:MAG: EAL domain-containing protein [Dehalococcoidia bacterium]